ncbi:MAG: electron transport complex protein RnfA [Christensenellaceae bacterium]
MEFFTLFLTILVSGIFINNFILVQFLGICPFLGVSKKVSSATGMGVAVTVVMILATAVTYPLYEFILVPLKLEYLEIILFIFVIAALVQMLENILRRFVPSLYKTMGIYLPLITTNCAILGVAELVINETSMLSILGIEAMNYGIALLYALAAGIGFTVAIVLMSGMRERIDKLSLPKSLKGAPITMIAACFIAMAFYVFTLI